MLLFCDAEENVRRIQTDSRDGERILRAIRNSHTIYEGCSYPAIDVTCLTPEETAGKICQLLADTKEN